MKSIVFGIILGACSLASTAMANSGSFCNESNRRIEYVCEQTPGGGGWVPQGDGCFHRDTGQSCSSNPGGHNPPPPPYNPPPYNPPHPPVPPPYNPPPYYPPYNPGHGGGGNVVCRADDNGWEEHRSHRSCGECLREHGRCTETCGVTEYISEAQGFDYSGRVVKFRGEGATRYQAENEAIRNCAYNASRCQNVSTRASEDVISRRECR